MDKLDKELILELQESDALTPKVTEIAKKLGKSTTTVHSRIKRLERQGVIKGYRATIDPKKIGKEVDVFYFIKAGRGGETYEEDEIAKKLKEHPNVKAVYNTMGEWDLMVEFVGKDSAEYLEFVRATEPLNGITDTKGKAVLKVYDSDFKLIPE